MKKFIAFILGVCLTLCAIAAIQTAKQNKNRYYVEAYCEQINNELHFIFYGNEFIYILNKNESAPKDKFVMLLMDNNGTENYLEDDMIIKWEKGV